MLRFFLLSFSIQAVPFVLELRQPVREAVILPFTAGPAALNAWLVGLFDGWVVSSGIVLTHVPINFAESIERFPLPAKSGHTSARIRFRGGGGAKYIETFANLNSV